MFFDGGSVLGSPGSDAGRVGPAVVFCSGNGRDPCLNLGTDALVRVDASLEDAEKRGHAIGWREVKWRVGSFGAIKDSINWLSLFSASVGDNTCGGVGGQLESDGRETDAFACWLAS